MYGHYSTTVGGRKSARRIAVFYLSGALVFAGNLLPNGKRVLAFQVAKLRDRRPEWRWDRNMSERCHGALCYELRYSLNWRQRSMTTPRQRLMATA